MKEWVRLQRELFENVQQEVKRTIGKRPIELRLYEKLFHQDQKKFKPISQSQLHKAMNESTFICIGDFHTLRQSQRLVLRFLRDSTLLKPDAIGFEILEAKHEISLKRWLQSMSPLAEQKFRRELNIEIRWGSSWETYRELFLQCHKLDIRILCLGSSQKSLKARDRHAVEVLKRERGRRWILFGEFHCARPQIPKLLKNLNQGSVTVVQQNDDRWTLRSLPQLRTKKSLVLEAPKSPIRLFCILHTPLWIKWQSFLDYQVNHDPDWGDHSSDESFDAHDQIRWCLSTLADFLEDSRYEAPISRKELLDFSVLAPEDSGFSISLARLNPKSRQLLMQQLQLSKVAVDARRKLIFIAEKSINSCAQAAGAYLYAGWSRSSSQARHFFTATLAEAIGFFLSKILNHSRRAQAWSDWKRTDPKISGLAQSLFRLNTPLLQRAQELQKLNEKSPLTLGRLLADNLFEAFLAGEFSRQRLIRILTGAQNEVASYLCLVEMYSVGRAFERHERASW